MIDLPHRDQPIFVKTLINHMQNKLNYNHFNDFRLSNLIKICSGCPLVMFRSVNNY